MIAVRYQSVGHFIGAKPNNEDEVNVLAAIVCT